MPETTSDKDMAGDAAGTVPPAKKRASTTTLLSVLGVLGSACLVITDRWSGIKTIVCDVSDHKICFSPEANGASKASVAECDRMTSAGWDPFRSDKSIKASFDRIDEWPAIKACKQALERTSDDQTEANRLVIGRINFQIGRAYDKAAQNDESFFTNARNYYEDALNKKYWSAAVNLGILYEDGHLRGERNEQKAAWYYKQAADVNVPQGNYCYAIALVFGWPYDTDAEKSEKRLNDRKSAIYYLSRITAKFPETEDYIWESKALLNDILAKDKRETRHFECNKEDRNGLETRKTKAIPYVEVD